MLFSSLGDKNLRDLPNAIAKRDLLFGAKKATPEEWKAMATAFEQADWLSDAADFSNQSQNNETLKKIRSLAQDEGNSFLFMKASRFLGEEDTVGLLACAQKAESLGKIRYALKAYEKLERKEDYDRVKSLVAQDGDIQAEEESKVFIPPSEDEITEEE